MVSLALYKSILPLISVITIEHLTSWFKLVHNQLINMDQSETLLINGMTTDEESYFSDNSLIILHEKRVE